jgi:hypothetical protein
MRIEITEIDNRGIYDAWSRPDGALIYHGTRTPLLSAARALLARGADPSDAIEMVRCGSDRVDMRAPIGVAAQLTVKEGGGPPRFVPYKPFSRDQE